MSDQQGEEDLKQRSERLADLMDQLADQIEAGNLSPKDLLTAEMLTERLESQLNPAESSQLGVAGQANGPVDFTAAAEVDEPADVDHQADIPLNAKQETTEQT